MSRAWCVSVGLVLVVAGAGCLDSVQGQPLKLVPVTGKVTNDGAPLPGAQLTFIPISKTDKSELGSGGNALTDDQGNFVAKYRGETDGLAPGKYKVAFTRYLRPDGKPLAPGESPTDAGAVEGMAPHLANPEESPVTIEVPDGGLKDHEIQLQGALVGVQ